MAVHSFLVQLIIDGAVLNEAGGMCLADETRERGRIANRVLSFDLVFLFLLRAGCSIRGRWSPVCTWSDPCASVQKINVRLLERLRNHVFR